SVSASLNFKGVPLASPNEIRRQFGVGRLVAVVFQSGRDPIMAGLLPWYNVPDMQAVVTDLHTAPVRAPGKVRHAIPRRKRPNPDQGLIDAYEEITRWKGVPEGHQFGIKDVEDDET